MTYSPSLLLRRTTPTATRRSPRMEGREGGIRLGEETLSEGRGDKALSSDGEGREGQGGARRRSGGRERGREGGTIRRRKGWKNESACQ
jgi:hypothetical protein